MVTILKCGPIDNLPIYRDNSSIIILWNLFAMIITLTTVNYLLY